MSFLEDLGVKKGSQTGRFWATRSLVCCFSCSWHCFDFASPRDGLPLKDSNGGITEGGYFSSGSRASFLKKRLLCYRVSSWSGIASFFCGNFKVSCYCKGVANDCRKSLSGSWTITKSFLGKPPPFWRFLYHPTTRQQITTKVFPPELVYCVHDYEGTCKSKEGWLRRRIVRAKGISAQTSWTSSE